MDKLTHKRFLKGLLTAQRLHPYLFSVAPVRGIVVCIAIAVVISIFFISCFSLERQGSPLLRHLKLGEFLRFLDLIELKSLDLRFLLRENIKPSGDVVIVAIDEETLAREAAYPLPRGRYAQMVDRLADAGAKVIAFDIFLAEPQNRDQLAEIDKTAAEYRKSHPDARPDDPVLRVLADHRKAFDEDAKLAAALQRALEKNVFVIMAGHFFTSDQAERERLPVRDLGDSVYRTLVESAYFQKQRVRLREGEGLASWFRPYVLPKDRPRHAVSTLIPLPRFLEQLPGAGFVDYTPDKDGVLRSEFMVTEYKNEFYPPLSVQALIWYLGLDPRKDVLLKFWGERKADDKSGSADVVLKYCQSVKLGATEIPIEQSSRMFINFRGPSGTTFPIHSLSRVLDGSVDPKNFTGKLVLVGATAKGAGDFIVTPHTARMPGVEKHANVIDCMLRKDFIRLDFRITMTDLGVLLGLALFVGLMMAFLTATAGLFAAMVVWLLLVWYCYHQFAHHHVWHNVTYPSLAIFSTFSFVTLYRFSTEARRKREVKRVFEQYMQASVVTEVLRHADEITLGGDVREITVFFSDLAGFSTISEQLTPQGVIAFLNDCYDEMAPAILQRNAFLDKFWGDAVVAAFGVPIRQHDHAVQACLAALDCQARLERLNAKLEAAGRPLAKARIGLHSGQAVVGNVGSRQARRFNYTALGDAVNLGARLESANKDFQTNIIISGATYALAKYAIEARELGRVLVKGRKEPAPVYELLGEMNKTPGHLLVLADLFHHGLGLFQKRDWDGAIFAFQKALVRNPDDGPSLVYLRACRNLKENPPPADWDGILVMKEGKD